MEMVLFHVSPLLPLLTDHFIAIQRARSTASSHGACPAPSASRAPSPWGDKPICLPCSQAAIPGTLCAPQAPLASSEPQTHPGPGRGPGFSQVRAQTGSEEMHDCHCSPTRKPREKAYHREQDTAAMGTRSLETAREPLGFPARKTQALLLRGRSRSPKFRKLRSHRVVQLPHLSGLPSALTFWHDRSGLEGEKQCS